MSSEEEKNNEIEEKKDENNQKSLLTLLTLDEYYQKYKKTKFTPKSNKRWIYFKPKKKDITPEVINKIINSNKSELIPENNIIIEKWKDLQKLIKEEISLEELMIEKQMQDNSQLQEKFKEYYDIKLKCRKEYEIINTFENPRTKVKDYIINNNIEKDLLDTCEPVKNLMFLLRNNYDYIVRLKNCLPNEKEEQINSLVELLCNQFYDNILIPSKNQNNEELGILIYKLLEDEIISMNSAIIDEFLNDNSFMGKFLTTYVRKDEFRLFFGKLLKPIITSIENKDEDCLDISITNIKSKLTKKERFGSNPNKNINSNKEEELDFSELYKDIKKTTIEFKKHMDLESSKTHIKFNNEDSINLNIKNNIINTNSEETAIDNSFSNSDNKLPTISKKKSLSQIKGEYNTEYSIDLTQDKIITNLLKEQDPDIKSFYLHQLEQINTDPDIFTNNGLKNILYEYNSKEAKNILNKYKQNFHFIKDTIDSLLQELIDKIHVIPYSIRCICKIIYILISKKFERLPKFIRNAFIGKFLFDKCIFPILSLDSKNANINRIFNSCVKGCVNVIVNILSTANKGSLYMTNADPEKTIFNYYLIEIIPILNKFYEQLIDIKLPSHIEKSLETIDKQIKDNINNRIFHFNRRKNPTKNEKKEKKEKINNNKINTMNLSYDYDYFKENPDEIMRLQGICFSISDVKFILSLICDENDKNQKIKKLFENLPEFNFFNKTIERIKCDDYKLDELISSDNKKKVFYVIFKEERNNQLENLFKSKKDDKNTFYINEKMDKEPSMILNKMKFSIKNILKNIELNFSYLDKAITTDKLFSALFYHLNEIGENTEIFEQVPIKWYAKYIYENKNNIDVKYRKNDYQLLYEEMTDQEKKKLDELKDITSKIITKNNININCATDLLKKINYSLMDVIEEKKIAKIEKFIETEEIKVCILTSKGKDKDKESQKIIIREVEECQINNDFHNDNGKNRNRLNCHTHYIKDFINKFSYESWEKDKDSNRPAPRKLVTFEINSNNRRTKIYKSFKDYMNIVKKRLREPVNNKNLFKDITDYNELLDKIEDYIFRQIYKYVYPEKHKDQDNKFFAHTQSLDWVTPKMLDIKNISINLLDHTINCTKKLDEGKSVNDKLNVIREVHASLNNIIKFSNGSENDAGQDEITPLFQYVIIKAQPRRIYSNLSYIKTFLDETELSGAKGFLITQMESAISYIEKINKDNFKMKEQLHNE